MTLPGSRGLAREGLGGAVATPMVAIASPYHPQDISVVYLEFLICNIIYNLILSII